MGWVLKGDPRARERFQESIKTTIGFPISNAMYWLLYAKSKIKGDRNKAGENLTKALNPEIDVPLVKMFYEMMTNYDTFANKAIVPDQYMKLAPELQFNQYVSELAIRMGKMTDLSPAMIDHLITGLFGSLGRDVLSLKLAQPQSPKLKPGRPVLRVEVHAPRIPWVSVGWRVLEGDGPAGRRDEARRGHLQGVPVAQSGVRCQPVPEHAEAGR